MAPFGPLISGADLAEALAEPRPNLHAVDVRWYLDGRSGLDAYRGAHVPGAVWLDIDTELADPVDTGTGRHPLPSPERFAAALARVGIGRGDTVVAYDDAGGSVAARLWWLLHVLGEPVAVLDGGLAAYPGELTTDLPAVAPVQRLPVPWPAPRFVSAEDTAAGIATGTATVYDARTAERYAQGGPVDPRPGHIPGAVSAPWAGNLGADGGFRAPGELRARFAGNGRRIAYCGSGVTACHDLLAMRLAGLEDTALYPGSWSQWGADPGRPARTGSAP